MELDINLDIIREIKEGVRACPVKEFHDGLQRFALVREDIWGNICELLYQIDKELGFELPKE